LLMKSYDLFAAVFKSFQEKGQLKCYPRYAIFFVQGDSLEPLQEALMAFVIVRRLSGHPVVVGRWND